MGKIQILFNEKDELILKKILLNELNNNQYLYSENKLSYVSIFSNEIVNDKCFLITIDSFSFIKKFLDKIFYETYSDVKDFFCKEIFFGKNFLNDLLDDYINQINEQSKINGYIKSTIIYFGEKITKCNENNKKDYFIFYINLLNNILMLFGCYIDWEKKYKNSTIGFWSQFFELLITNNDVVIKDKFLNNYVEHLNLNIMNPIYFDNGKDNKNLDIKNINIEFIKNFNEVNINLLFCEYQEKIKKIDRLLLSIFNEMEF